MKLTAFAAALLALPGFAHAQTTINFNDVQDGTVINSAYSALGITFAGETAFSHDVQATTDGGVFSSNALDATPGVVDIFFDPAQFAYGVGAFQVTSLADPAGFGSTAAAFNFYDGSGALVYSFSPFDQTATSTVVFGGLPGGIQKIVLPADAYYDNFSFQPAGAPVPEASSTVSLGLLLAAGGLVLLRRRRQAAR